MFISKQNKRDLWNDVRVAHKRLDHLVDWIGEIAEEVHDLKQGRDGNGGEQTARDGYYGDGDEYVTIPVVYDNPSKDTTEVEGDWEYDAYYLYQKLYDILVSKQHDYGPDNIQKSPGGPLNGLQVRLFDKMARLQNLVANGATPKHESLRDTFIDIANYGVIGVMIIDGTFPKSKEN